MDLNGYFNSIGIYHCLLHNVSFQQFSLSQDYINEIDDLRLFHIIVSEKVMKILINFIMEVGNYFGNFYMKSVFLIHSLSIRITPIVARTALVFAYFRHAHVVSAETNFSEVLLCKKYIFLGYGKWFHELVLTNSLFLCLRSKIAKRIAIFSNFQVQQLIHIYVLTKKIQNTHEFWQHNHILLLKNINFRNCENYEYQYFWYGFPRNLFSSS